MRSKLKRKSMKIESIALCCREEPIQYKIIQNISHPICSKSNYYIKNLAMMKNPKPKDTKIKIPYSINNDCAYEIAVSNPTSKIYNTSFKQFKKFWRKAHANN